MTFFNNFDTIMTTNQPTPRILNMLALLSYFYDWLLFQMGFQNHIGLLGQLWDIFLLFIFAIIVIAVVVSAIQTNKESKK